MDAIAILRVVLSLAAVLGVMWWVNKRVRGGKAIARFRKQRPVTVIGKQSLGKNASVIVIDTDGRRLLLGVTDHQVTLLRESDAPEPTSFETELNAVDTDTITAAASNSTPQPAAPNTKTTKTTKPVTQGSLDGSILSPATWKKAGEALGVGAKK